MERGRLEDSAESDHLRSWKKGCRGMRSAPGKKSFMRRTTGLFRRQSALPLKSESAPLTLLFLALTFSFTFALAFTFTLTPLITLALAGVVLGKKTGCRQRQYRDCATADEPL